MLDLPDSMSHTRAQDILQQGGGDWSGGPAKHETDCLHSVYEGFIPYTKIHWLALYHAKKILGWKLHPHSSWISLQRKSQLKTLFAFVSLVKSLQGFWSFSSNENSQKGALPVTVSYIWRSSGSSIHFMLMWRIGGNGFIGYLEINLPSFPLALAICHVSWHKYSARKSPLLPILP